MSRGPSIELVRSGLMGRVRELADTLAPADARIDGITRWSLNPMRNDRTAGSFKIDIGGSHAGRWYEFAEGIGGDLIDLIAYCRCQGAGSYQSREARGAAIKWAIDWLGLEGADPAKLRASEAEAKARAKTYEAKAAKDDQARKRKARGARGDWLAAPFNAFEHEISRRYLVEARGIDPALLAGVPGGLRFEPDGPRQDHFKQIDPETGEILPAIITCAVNGEGRIRGVHRTFLAVDGSGKAPIERAKRMYGSIKGAALRLTKGKTGLSPEEAGRRGLSGDVLAISEGIEDGFSWAMMEPEHRVWAAGSLDLIGDVPIPACISRVILLAQNDPPDSVARLAFDRAAARILDRFGRPVDVVRPADPGVKDWNDLWCGLDEGKADE